jgi:spermidine/putrescine-binding protein
MLLESLKSDRMNRRQLNKALASVGLGLMTLPVMARRARAGKTPVVFEWSGYEVPELFGEYLSKHGEAPEFAFFADEDEALQKIRNGFEADLTHPCTDTMRKFADAGIVEPIDTARLKHWGNVFPALQSFEGVVLDGKVMMLPLDWGNSSVVYNTELAGDYVGEESWNILFDEKYAGRLSMYDSDSAVVVAGLALGVPNVWNMTDAEIAEARKLLEKQVELVRFYWSDQTELEQAMASGEIVAGYAWNDAYVRLKEAGVPVKYMVPKEGILTWLCGLVRLNTGEGDEQMTYDFLDAWLAPETGKYVIEEFGYGHANAKAFDLVAPETLAGLGFSTDPTEMLASGHIFELIPPATYQKYIDMFEEVKALSGS